MGMDGLMDRFGRRFFFLLHLLLLFLSPCSALQPGSRCKPMSLFLIAKWLTVSKPMPITLLRWLKAFPQNTLQKMPDKRRGAVKKLSENHIYWYIMKVDGMAKGAVI